MLLLPHTNILRLPHKGNVQVSETRWPTCLSPLLPSPLTPYRLALSPSPHWARFAGLIYFRVGAAVSKAVCKHGWSTVLAFPPSGIKGRPSKPPTLRCSAMPVDIPWNGRGLLCGGGLNQEALLMLVCVLRPQRRSPVPSCLAWAPATCKHSGASPALIDVVVRR